MSHLTRRAEQALLGAVLADGTATATSQEALDLLVPDDFGHRAHRQVFEALAELRTLPPDASVDELLTAVADRVTAPGADHEWLTQLRSAAPPAGHITAYTQMIQTGALRRDIATHAQRIAEAMPGPLGEALLRNARIHRSLTGDGPATPGPTPQVQTRGSSLNPAQGLEDRRVETLDRGSAARGSEMRSRYEELLLADLLQNPEQVHVMADAFDESDLTTEHRAEIYRTIVNVAQSDTPVDEVTVAWYLDQQRAIHAMYGTEGVQGPDVGLSSEPDLVYIDRLASTVSAFPAVEIARFIVAEDVRARLADINPELRTRSSLDPPSATAVADRPPMPLDPARHRPHPPEAPAPNPRAQP